MVNYSDSEYGAVGYSAYGPTSSDLQNPDSSMFNTTNENVERGKALLKSNPTLFNKYYENVRNRQMYQADIQADLIQGRMTEGQQRLAASQQKQAQEEAVMLQQQTDIKARGGLTPTEVTQLQQIANTTKYIDKEAYTNSLLNAFGEQQAVTNITTLENIKAEEDYLKAFGQAQAESNINYLQERRDILDQARNSSILQPSQEGDTFNLSNIPMTVTRESKTPVMETTQSFALMPYLRGELQTWEREKFAGIDLSQAGIRAEEFKLASIRNQGKSNALGNIYNYGTAFGIYAFSGAVKTVKSVKERPLETAGTIGLFIVGGAVAPLATGIVAGTSLGLDVITSKDKFKASGELLGSLAVYEGGFKVGRFVTNPKTSSSINNAFATGIKQGTKFAGEMTRVTLTSPMIDLFKVGGRVTQEFIPSKATGVIKGKLEIVDLYKTPSRAKIQIEGKNILSLEYKPEVKVEPYFKNTEYFGAERRTVGKGFVEGYNLNVRDVAKYRKGTPTEFKTPEIDLLLKKGQTVKAWELAIKERKGVFWEQKAQSNKVSIEKSIIRPIELKDVADYLGNKKPIEFYQAKGEKLNWLKQRKAKGKAEPFTLNTDVVDKAFTEARANTVENLRLTGMTDKGALAKSEKITWQKQRKIPKTPEQKLNYLKQMGIEVTFTKKIIKPEVFKPQQQGQQQLLLLKKPKTVKVLDLDKLFAEAKIKVEQRTKQQTVEIQKPKRRTAQIPLTEQMKRLNTEQVMGQVQVYKPRQISSSKSKLGLSSISRQSTVSRTKSLILPMQTQRQRQVQVQKQRQSQIQLPIQEQRQKQIPIQQQIQLQFPKQIQKQRQSQVQVQIQKQLTIPRQRTTPVTIPISIIIPKQIPVIIPNLITPPPPKPPEKVRTFLPPTNKQPNNPSYQAFIKTNEGYKAASQPMPKNKALNTAFNIVDNTTAKSFILRRVGQTTTRDEALSNKFAEKLRRVKGRSKLNVYSYVEKDKYAIDSIGEKIGLKYRG